MKDHEDRLFNTIITSMITSLAQNGLPTDIQGLLLQGNVEMGVPPNVLKNALSEALRQLSFDVDHKCDSYECETCGYSYAEGAEIKLNGQEFMLLEPVAHCFGGTSYSETEIASEVFASFGIKYEV